MKVEPYNPTIGCLALRIPKLSAWVVVAPNGQILSKHGIDEAGARNQAMFNNLTVTAEERDEWAAR